MDSCKSRERNEVMTLRLRGPEFGSHGGMVPNRTGWAWEVIHQVEVILISSKKSHYLYQWHCTDLFLVSFLFCFAFTAAIGLLYPCIDRHLGEPHKFKREWSSVMRCVAVFVGINHASAVSFSAVARITPALKFTRIFMHWTNLTRQDSILKCEVARLLLNQDDV